MFLPLNLKLQYNMLALSGVSVLLKKFIYTVQSNFPEMLIKSEISSNTDLMYILKSHSLFKVDFLNDIVITDYLNIDSRKRFLISYIVTSISFNFKYRLNVWVPEGCSLCSLSILFKNSLWLEREAWDFFGVFFSKHLDLRRILTDYGFKGYPLRKDFPLVGFYEIYYENKEKKTLYKQNVFCQEYRSFAK